jgi:hypothetical protein
MATLRRRLASRGNSEEESGFVASIETRYNHIL